MGRKHAGGAATRVFVLGLVGGLAAAALLVLTPAAGARRTDKLDRCAAGYAYSGVYSDTRSFGVSATITAIDAEIASGHVAAYVNVGDRRRWLQIGINRADTGPARSQHLYYELHLPGRQTIYRELGDVDPGARVHVAVAAAYGHPGYWLLSLDGKPPGHALFLPDSTTGLLASASSENFQRGDTPCNTFAYEFTALRTLPRAGSSWQPGTALYRVSDPGTSFTWQSRATRSFRAAGMHS